MVASVSQEGIDIEKARSGQHPFPAHVPRELLMKVRPQVNFDIIARTEIDMPAFRSHRMIARAVPAQAAFPEAGSGGDDGNIAARCRLGAGIEHEAFAVL